MIINKYHQHLAKILSLLACDTCDRKNLILSICRCSNANEKFFVFGMMLNIVRHW
jgi:hypothetical protein